VGYLTHGHLNLTARRIITDTTIDDLRDRMRERIYSGNPPARGWAAVRWRNEGEDPPRRDRTNPGSPMVEDFGDYRVLLARLFVDCLNRTLLTSVGNKDFGGMRPDLRFTVEAFDVAVIDGDSLHVLIASHNDDGVATILGELRLAADAGEDWEVGTMPKIEPTSDLYLWMLYRWHASKGALSPTLKVVEFRTLTARDALDHVGRQLSGIDLTRVDTLGAAADAHSLGPAKFVLWDKQVGIRADLFLLLNGTFDVHRSGTEYDLGPMDKPQLGIHAALDVATRVLPRLHNAHARDKHWPTIRPRFVDECRKVLADRFSGP
jgi:hypothetical protein